MAIVPIIDEIAKMLDGFRERYRLNEDGPFTIVPGRVGMEVLRRENRLLGGEGERQYVMVGDIKVWVEEDLFAEEKTSGVAGGARVQAPSTGPKRDAFARRGKGGMK